MKFVGMLRIKDEAAWIAEVIASLLPLCEQIFILDDHSTDDTAEICRSFPEVTLLPSPFEGLDEARDKNYLLEHVIKSGADFVIHIDGDEVLVPDGQQMIRDLVARVPNVAIAKFRVLYAWNDKRTIRTDGIYACFSRPSLFRIAGQNTAGLRFGTTPHGGNLHCWNHPQNLQGAEVNAKHIGLIHYGYITPEIRARKHAFYNRVDPNNAYEDQYRHVHQGDPGGPPADARLKHAGPLKLEPLSL